MFAATCREPDETTEARMMSERDERTVERQGYNVSEAARIVGVGRTTMHKMLNQGHIRRVKIGARTIIPKSEIDRLLNGSR